MVTETSRVSFEAMERNLRSPLKQQVVAIINKKCGRWIDYTLKKNVKKPSGGKPGFVIYHTNYSMIASTDISGITLIE